MNFRWNKDVLENQLDYSVPSSLLPPPKSSNGRIQIWVLKKNVKDASDVRIVHFVDSFKRGSGIWRKENYPGHLCGADRSFRRPKRYVSTLANRTMALYRVDRGPRSSPSRAKRKRRRRVRSKNQMARAIFLHVPVVDDDYFGSEFAGRLQFVLRSVGWNVQVAGRRRTFGLNPEGGARGDVRIGVVSRTRNKWTGDRRARSPRISVRYCAVSFVQAVDVRARRCAPGAMQRHN